MSITNVLDSTADTDEVTDKSAHATSQTTSCLTVNQTTVGNHTWNILDMQSNTDLSCIRQTLNDVRHKFSKLQSVMSECKTD